MSNRTVSSSPHIHAKESTQRIMLDVCIALMPATIWGVIVFGFRALTVVLFSIGFSVLTEYLLGKISKENTVWDLSAVVTGLLIGLNMAPDVPLFIPCLASVFAIAVAKWTFGGLGANWANPAIAGRVFVFFSFSSAMSDFRLPSTLLNSASAAAISDIDSVSSATPLSYIKTVINGSGYKGMSSLDILAGENYLYSDFAAKISNITGWNVYNIDAFIGNIGGCIGEVSALLLIVGAVYLFIRKVIFPSISFSYLISFSLFTWIFGGTVSGLGLFHGEVINQLLRGSVIIAAFYMATDYVTSPITDKGRIIYGIGCGFFTFLFRFFGSLPEGASIAILLMNIATPTIDKFCKPVKFGSTGGKK